jgi:hypothetical protein
MTSSQSAEVQSRALSEICHSCRRALAIRTVDAAIDMQHSPGKTSHGVPSSLLESNNQIQRAARVVSLKRLWLQNGARWKRVTG